MLIGASPLTQAFLGTLFTWALTAFGAALAFFAKGTNERIYLDGSLGFAGGVMVAASYWSLLQPAIEMTSDNSGIWTLIPVVSGFFLGALFVYAADRVVTKLQAHSTVDLIVGDKIKRNPSLTEVSCENILYRGTKVNQEFRHRRKYKEDEEEVPDHLPSPLNDQESHDRWKRIMLLIIAVTVHNIPEGLAVGVAFGAVGKSSSATFESARNLAIGIGIQNLPEGLAVSLPLKMAGYSTGMSIWYGQLSGLVELFAGVFGAFLVSWIIPVLPYALSFAAGAMIYVVVDDIIPESQSCGNGKVASWGCIFGFLLMMSLDVGLAD
uniref:Zinc transporter ZIP11 n=1 Tax=Caligus rogercresseyi TaxID=217165 RepID=C1BNU3_CALRO|nr:Zinc transporter SLC39A11 [Caligus rogercresseyi]